MITLDLVNDFMLNCWNRAKLADWDTAPLSHRILDRLSGGVSEGLGNLLWDCCPME